MRAGTGSAAGASASSRGTDARAAACSRPAAPCSLEPMTSLERKLVHLALQDVAGVETRSEGDDPDRGTSSSCRQRSRSRSDRPAARALARRAARDAGTDGDRGPRARRAASTSRAASPRCRCVARFAGPIVDVGSGGGSPGIPLAAALPDREVTLLEANARKAAFLERVAARLPERRGRSRPRRGAGRRRRTASPSRARSPRRRWPPSGACHSCGHGRRGSPLRRADRRLWTAVARVAARWEAVRRRRRRRCSSFPRWRRHRPAFRAGLGWRASARWPDR